MKLKEVDGTPCKIYRCHRCCYETEMILFLEDIKRLCLLGYRIEEFANKHGKAWVLKNINGKCFFLEEKGCKIYGHRPYGCRLYPLIYDVDIKKVIIDRECPHANKFYITTEHIKSLEHLIKKLKINKK